MRLVLGRAGTGKNRYVFADIKEKVASGVEVCLLVPEQTLFSIEKRLFLLVGPEQFKNCNVMSFSNLADLVLQMTGNAGRERINDAAKVTLIRRAIGSLTDEITYYRRNRNSVAFHRMVASVIDECKEAFATPAKLQQLADDSVNRITKSKLHELSLIFEKYEELLGERYEDQSDHMTAAAAAIAASNFITGKIVYIDGFTGFSGPEYLLIRAIASVSKETVVTLLGDKHTNSAEIFEVVRRTESRLKDMLSDGTPDSMSDGTPDTIYIPANKADLAPGIAALEGFLVGDERKYSDLDGIYLIEEKGPYEELTRVAAEITALVRDSNYRYSEIAIIARNIESYRAATERTFRLFDIPYFADWTDNESYSSTAAFIRAALLIIEETTAEHMLGLLKTSLTSMSAGDIAIFENYIYVWNLDHNRLRQPFTKNPDGFSERFSDEAYERLAVAEQTRLTLTGWVQDFMRETENATASDIIKQIYILMTKTGAIDKLTELGQAGNTVQLFEQLYHILGGATLEPSEITGIADVLFNETYTGRIPPMLEQVQVGSADRIRTNQPKVVFVLGLLEGVFPALSFEFPLLSHKERGYMCDAGVELANSFDSLLQLEQLYFYNALTSGNERVYLSIPKLSTGGELLGPSEPIASFLETYPVPSAPTVDNPFSTVVNQATARVRYLEDESSRQVINNSSLFDFTDDLNHLADEPKYMLQDQQLLQQKLNNRVRLSPSSIESFFNCRFSYFLRYMANIYPVKPAKLSYLEAGNYIHFILEQVFREKEGDLRTIELTEIYSLAEKASKQYVETNLSSADDSSNQLSYQISRLNQQAVRLLLYLKQEQLSSDFRPVDFELTISDSGQVEPRNLTLDDGTTVKVNGKVDRVDIATIGSKQYIRVMDYKTGTKSFSLDDVVYGLNMQMLIYLFLIAENTVNRYGTSIPAGVLYIPSDPPIMSIDVGIERVKEAYRMDGMIVSDEDIMEAMEHGGGGVYIPNARKGDSFKIISDKNVTPDEMERLKHHIDSLIVGMVESIKSGDIDAVPTVKNNLAPCRYCDYASVCRNDRITKTKEISRGAHKILRGGEADD
ncbi:MAG: PD-(D/E)XK nuclease family protein [Oscillospiraceae bacterium]|nr:PD-(D/E)XK nuclease family protein [Oscillospiraceae bacterium]